MGVLKKFIIGSIVLSLVGINFPGTTICNAASLFAQADLDAITRHDPKILSSPEEDIPLKQSPKGEKKGISKWVWIGLGVLAIGGIAAAAAGGGGGGGDDDPEDPDEEGDVSFTW